jgi:hypothetical protein
MKLRTHETAGRGAVLLALLLGLQSCSEAAENVLPAQATGVSTGQPAASGTVASSVASIAQEVARDVAQVTDSLHGTSPGGLFLLPENHASRLGQVQTAICLVRLHGKGIKDIALEGYTIESGALKTDWSGMETHSPGARRRVALALLEEGEISQAEFMALAYKDVTLHPVEREEEYDTELDDDAAGAQYQALFAIAAKSLTSAQIREANRLAESGKANEAWEFVVNNDAWCKEQYSKLKDTRVFSIESQLNSLEAVERRAVSQGVDLDPKVRDGLQRQKRFFELRGKATPTMMDLSLALSARIGGPVPLVMGAAHSEAAVTHLKKQRASYAVISSLALLKQGETKVPSNLTEEQYDRKNSNPPRPVGPPGSIGARLAASGKKPRPVLNTRWLPTKEAIYEVTAVLAEAAARGGTPPAGRPPGGRPPAPPAAPPPSDPPFGLPDDALSGPGFRVDKGSISRVAGGVVFKVVVNGKDFWIGARRETELGDEKYDDEWLERALLGAMRRLEGNTEEQAAKEEKEAGEGVFRPTLDTIGYVGTTRAGVVAAMG